MMRWKRDVRRTDLLVLSSSVDLDDLDLQLLDGLLQPLRLSLQQVVVYEMSVTSMFAQELEVDLPGFIPADRGGSA